MPVTVSWRPLNLLQVNVNYDQKSDLVECGNAVALNATYVMNAVAEEDPSRPLWPASPSSGWLSGVTTLWHEPEHGTWVIPNCSHCVGLFPTTSRWCRVQSLYLPRKAHMTQDATCNRIRAIIMVVH
jgi:hypothetical protein